MSILAASLLLALQPTYAAGSPITVGVEIEVAQGEDERVLNVVLPESFEDNSDRKFPVVILLDGGRQQWLLDAASAFARSARRRHAQEVILVGIDTTGRRRFDLTPPMRAKLEVDPEHEGGGGAPEFRAWLAGKAIPLIENQFRGNGQVFLIGHSLGGLFALETLGDHVLTVSGVAAISPALWWDEDAPLHRLVATLPTSDDLPPIFVAVADEDPDLMRSVITLKDSLSGHDLLCFEDRAQQNHGTIVPSVLLQIGPCLWPVPPAPPNEAE